MELAQDVTRIGFFFSYARVCPFHFFFGRTSVSKEIYGKKRRQIPVREKVRLSMIRGCFVRPRQVFV